MMMIKIFSIKWPQLGTDPIPGDNIELGVVFEGVLYDLRHFLSHWQHDMWHFGQFRDYSVGGNEMIMEERKLEWMDGFWDLVEPCCMDERWKSTLLDGKMNFHPFFFSFRG